MVTEPVACSTEVLWFRSSSVSDFSSWLLGNLSPSQDVSESGRVRKKAYLEFCFETVQLGRAQTLDNFFRHLLYGSISFAFPKLSALGS